ncbi:MAG: acyltransferase domain-containing protein [Actinophytocola sp.]|uniref:acyltransferase domain-containing protein n=1 Tax=Actinophytocola sp. TaxID=1872138 RepID=UPI003C767608
MSVGLFPGQGSYRIGCLDGLLTDPDARHAIEAVDDIAAEQLGRGLIKSLVDNAALGDDGLADAEPELVQVAAFAASVAVFEVLRAKGATLSVLVGHSLGEIAALVAAGALTLEEGTRILFHRFAALREHDTSGGRMVALSCDRQRAEQILALLPSSDAVVAVANGATQTAVSGPADALRRVARVADAIGMTATHLRAPHPFHNPLLEPARRAFAERVRGHRSHGFRIPVFSPILGRYYRDQDDLGELLAAHLVTPVEFGAAVSRAHGSGARVWVEVGGGRALTNLVRARHPEVTVLTPLHGSPEALTDTVRFLGGATTATTPAPAPVPAPVAQPAPVVAAAPAVAPATPPVATQEVPRTAISRDVIEARVRKLYADALEYPEEVFEHEAELEADLGIDSVKQTELMARVGDVFELGPRPEGMRMGDYRTFGKVIDFVADSLPAVNGSRR